MPDDHKKEPFIPHFRPLGPRGQFIYRDIRHTPLGTAKLEDFSNDDIPYYTPGAFWCGYLMNGMPIGIKDDTHVCVVAGTRSNKGVAIVVPNLTLYPGSVVVLDPKGENAKITARRRARGSERCRGMGQKVWILDPMNEVRTEDDDFADLKARYNPLDAIKRDDPEAVDIAAGIADALIIRESTQDPFFTDSARTFLQMVILHVATGPYFEEEERNLITVRRLVKSGYAEEHEILTQEAKPGEEVISRLALLFKDMQANKFCDGVIADHAAGYMDMTDGEASKTLMSIIQVARTAIDFLNSPQLAETLTNSNVSLRELKTAKDGASLYICLSQRYMETHAGWLRMMLTLILHEMERLAFQPACGHPVMVVMDEFASLKRMTIIENAAAQIAGYGVRLVFVVQALPQLKAIYKDNWETLVASCGTKIFFGNDDYTTQDYASKLIGHYESRRETQNASYSRSTSLTRGSSISHGTTQGSSAGASSSMSLGSSTTMSTSSSYSTSASSTSGRNETLHARLLLAPDEIRRFLGDKDTGLALLIRRGKQPLILKLSPYYADPMFRGYYDHDGNGKHQKLATLLELERIVEEERAMRQESMDLLGQKMENEVLKIASARYMATAATQVRRSRLIANVAIAAMVLVFMTIGILSLFAMTVK